MRFSSWLIAACAAGIGCTGSTTPSTQVITGGVTTSGAVGVRAITGDTVVTASRVATDGTFALSLPSGSQYRLEIMTQNGVERVVDTSSADVTFRVCAPTGPFDMGTLGGSGSGSGGGDPHGCPPPFDGSDSGSGDSTTDMGSGALPPHGPCPPPPCDPSTDASCPPPPPPPCADPTDPTTCNDPCMSDPGQCGCDATMDSTTGSGSLGECWPPPCSGSDCPPPPDGSTCPDHMPHDFGCGSDAGGSGGSGALGS